MLIFFGKKVVRLSQQPGGVSRRLPLYHRRRRPATSCVTALMTLRFASGDDKAAFDRAKYDLLFY
jgi:hypothetical protein